MYPSVICTHSILNDDLSCHTVIFIVTMLSSHLPDKMVVQKILLIGSGMVTPAFLDTVLSRVCDIMYRRGDE